MALVLDEVADDNVQEATAAADGLYGLSENVNGVPRQHMLMLMHERPGSADIAGIQRCVRRIDGECALSRMAPWISNGDSPVHGHEKVPTVGHVEGSAGGHLKVPALHG